MIEPTDEMRRAFRAVEGDMCDDCLDERLAAVLAIVERDYSLRPATCEAMQKNDWAVICEHPLLRWAR